MGGRFVSSPLAKTLGTALAAWLCTACVTNPATGGRELSLVSEEQEIATGRQAHQQIVRSIGIYGDEQLRKYVEAIGMRLAKASERPDLPWTFTVLDDPVVNAFALPGGFIYVTRGLLAHLTSEAQLAGVLAHEIGHVTARHSASQMSKAILANVGLGIGMILSPELAQFGDVAQAGVGLLFLKFGRDDEREADRLGLRYMDELDYRPGELLAVLAVLEAISERQGRGEIPGWLQTHPQTAERTALIRDAIAEHAPAPAEAIVRRERFLERTDGLVYGENPRHGYFAGNVLYHPDMRFRMNFPEGWTTVNQTHAAGAIHPGGAASISISLTDAPSARAAAERFFANPAIAAGPGGDVRINGMHAVSYLFGARAEQGPLSGRTTFLRFRGRVIQIVGFAPSPIWSQVQEVVDAATASFDLLLDPAILSLQPLRLQLVELPEPTTLQALASGWRSPVPLGRLALINHVEPGALLPGGALVRRVVGSLPPGARPVDSPAE